MTLVIEILNFGDITLEPGLDLSLVFLLISNPTNRLRLHQFLGTCSLQLFRSQPLNLPHLKFFVITPLELLDSQTV